MTKFKTEPGFESPFRVGKGQPIVFASALHKRCFQQLCRNVRGSNALQVVLGGPGTGKSTLLQLVAEQLGPPVKTMFCDARDLEKDTLLAHLARQIDGNQENESNSLDFDSFLSRARGFSQNDEILLILIDEAQILEDRELEVALSIADEAAMKRAGVVVAMAGMPGLERRIEDSAGHPCLSNAAVYTLTTLGAADIQEFVIAQLRQAGYPENTFSTGAIQTVAASSHGIPRLINRICNNALVRARISGQSSISQSQVEEASRNLPSAHIHEQSPNDGTGVVTAFKAKTVPHTRRAGDGSVRNIPRPDPRPISDSESGTGRGSSEHIAFDQREETKATPERPQPQQDKSEPKLGNPGELTDRTPPVDRNKDSRTLAEWNHHIDDKRASKWPVRSNLIGASVVLAIIACMVVGYQIYKGDSSSKIAQLIGSLNLAQNPKQGAGDSTPPSAAELASPAEETEASRPPGPAEVGMGGEPRQALGDGMDPADTLQQPSTTHDEIALRSQDVSPPGMQGERERVSLEVSQLVANARQALGNEEFELAADYVDKALDLSGESEELLALAAEIDRGQETAADGAHREREAARLRDLAQTQAGSGDYEPALSSIDSAMTLMPADTGLAAFRREIEKERKQALEQQEIAAAAGRLRDAAVALLAKGEYEAALVQVNEALALAPQEGTALLALRGRIQAEQSAALERERLLTKATSLGEEAVAAMIAENFDVALELADEALTYLPGNQALVDLRDEIETERSAALAAERASTEPTHLMDNARSLLEAGK